MLEYWSHVFWRALKEAWLFVYDHPGRFMIGAIALFVGVVGVRLQGSSEGWKDAAIQSLWGFGAIFLAFFLLFVWKLLAIPARMAIEQEKRLKLLSGKSPLDVNFDSSNEAFVKPVILLDPINRNKRYNGISVRVRVESIGAPVTNCRAFITKSEYSDDRKEFGEIAPFEKIPLMWALENSETITRIECGVQEFLGVIQSNDSVDYFSAQTNAHSFSRPPYFSKPGII